MRPIPLVRYHLTRTFKVMKRQGALPAALFDLAVIIICILYAGLAGSVNAVYVLFIFLAYFMWEISDAYKDDARDEMKAAVMTLTDETILLQAERDQLKEEVEVMKALTGSRKENPIKSNRLVSDKTFAVRLRNFMEGTMTCDACGEEEKEYFLHVSESLLKWQTKTVRKGSEENEVSPATWTDAAAGQLGLWRVCNRGETEKEAFFREETENKNKRDK